MIGQFKLTLQLCEQFDGWAMALIATGILQIVGWVDADLYSRRVERLSLPICTALVC